jgi:hypothetical protein
MSTATSKEKFKQAQVLLFSNMSTSVFVLAFFLNALKHSDAWKIIGLGIALVVSFTIDLLLFIKTRKLKKQLHF